MKRVGKMLVSILLTIVMISTAAVTTVNSLSINNTAPNKMIIDKKVWNGTTWVDEINASIGQTVRFRISIYDNYTDSNPNESYVLHNINVSDMLSDGLSYESGSAVVINGTTSGGGIRDIEPSINGHNLTWSFSYPGWFIVDGDTGYIEFNATVTGTGDLVNKVNVSAYHCTNSTLLLYGEAEATVHVTVPTPNIKIEKYAKYDCQDYSKEVDVSRGTEVTFRLVVSNIGNTHFDSLDVRDTLPIGLNYVINSSSPDVTDISGNILYWNFTDVNVSDFPINITFNATADGCGLLENVVNASAEYNCLTVYSESNATVNISCHPGLSLIKEVSLDGTNWTNSVEAYLPNVVHSGNKIYFSINVTNTGDVNLTGVLEDFLPPFLKYNYDSDVPVTFANDSYINWTATSLDPVEPGETILINFTATPLSGGDGYNTAIATTDQGINATSRTHVTLYEPYIVVDKKVKELCGGEYNDSVEANIGDVLQFMITIKYFGNPLDITNYAFHNITIRDVLPSALVYLSNSSEFSGDWSNWNEHYNPLTDKEPTILGNTLIWDFTAPPEENDIFWIPNNHTLTLIFDAYVSDNAEPCQTYENLANVTGQECSGTPLNGNDTALVKLPCPEYKVEKKVFDPVTEEWVDGAYFYPGNYIKFNITITNTGAIDIHNLTVSDTLQNVLSYVSANPVPSQINGQQLLWNVSNLASGESYYIEITVRALTCTQGWYDNIVFVYPESCSLPVLNDSASFYITSDGDSPQSHVADIEPYWHNGEFEVRAYASDPMPGSGVKKVALYYSYSSDNSTWSSWKLFAEDENDSDGWSWMFDAPDGDGFYKFYSIATDKVNNAEDSSGKDAEAIAGYDTVAPESRVAEISPYVQESTPIALSVDASDSLSGVSGYVVYYRYSSDNTTWNDTWYVANLPFNAPMGNGYYRFYSIATDLAGNSENAPSGYDTECRVDVPSPLVASISAPDCAYVGSDVEFSAVVSGGTSPYSYSWDFDDGGYGAGSHIVHVYHSTGVYNVTLTVVDNKSKTVTTYALIEICPLPNLEINITKPVAGGIYLGDVSLFSTMLNRAIIFGPITVTADVINASGDVSVEFLINNEIKYIDDSAPYNYTWKSEKFGLYNITVIVHDNVSGVGTRTASSSVDAIVFNFAKNRTTTEKPGLLKGKVYDAGTLLKKGIPRAKVTILELNKTIRTRFLMLSKGRYSVSLDPGIYIVKFEARGYAPEIRTVTITSGNTTYCSVGLNHTGSMYGKVIQKGKLLFRGVRGASIEVINNDTGVNYSAISKLFGKYSISDIPPGEYTVIVKADGYKDTIDYITIHPGKEVKKNLKMEQE